MFNMRTEITDPVEQRLFYYFETLFEIESTSSEKSAEEKAKLGLPSSDGQIAVLRKVREMLEIMGVEDIHYDPRYLIARLPGNEKIGCVGLVAHVDTAPCLPRGTELFVGEEASKGETVASALQKHQQVKVTVDGDDGLLGADDKAGCAILLYVAEQIMKQAAEHPEIAENRPLVELIFATDEEIGAGLRYLDTSLLKSKFALTVDGEEAPRFECENFNAAEAKVIAMGKSAHLGNAKEGGMISAIGALDWMCSLFPENEKPEKVEGKEGYYCLYYKCGGIERAEADFVIRDFEFSGLQRRVKFVEECAKKVAKETGAQIECKTDWQYRNMADFIDPKSKYISCLFDAARAKGVELQKAAIRGGTDGAVLSERGIPCPNLFTGARNIHSVKETWNLDEGAACAEILLEFLSQLGK